jgi:hypothetical protein
MMDTAGDYIAGASKRNRVYKIVCNRRQEIDLKTAWRKPKERTMSVIMKWSSGRHEMWENRCRNENLLAHNIINPTKREFFGGFRHTSREIGQREKENITSWIRPRPCCCCCCRVVCLIPLDYNSFLDFYISFVFLFFAGWFLIEHATWLGYTEEKVEWMESCPTKKKENNDRPRERS